MRQNTYLGVIGILSFAFATIQTSFIICYPMLGYLLFKISGGSYSVGNFKDQIPTGAYLLAIVLFAIAIIAANIICTAEAKNEVGT